MPNFITPADEITADNSALGTTAAAAEEIQEYDEMADGWEEKEGVADPKRVPDGSSDWTARWGDKADKQNMISQMAWRKRAD